MGAEIKPIFSIENISDDRDWTDKILFFQHKERFPFAFQKYAKQILHLR